MIIALLIKIYLYSENPYEAKHHYLIKKREKSDLQNLKYPKVLLNIQIICSKFIKILKNTTQAENLTY